MKILKELRFSMPFFVILILLSGCENKQPIITVYDFDMEYDTISSKFECNMTVYWKNNSEHSILKIPFNFITDSTRHLPTNILLNNEIPDIKLANKKNQGFDGFILTPKTTIEKGQEVIIKAKFKTLKGDFLREGVYFYEEILPVIQYFMNGKFNPNYRTPANYNVAISYPLEYNIATTGVIIQKDTINRKINIKTLAENVPFYGLVLLKDVIIKERESVNGIKIRSVFFEDDKKWGNRILDYADDAIRFYYDTLGFYPQSKLTIVPGYHKPYGGWPICPNIVGIHRGLDLKKEKAESFANWITAHEIGHQYWGYNYVLEPLDYPQWFGISMGIYTDRLYCKARNIEHNYFDFFDRYVKGVEKGFNTTIMQKVDSLDKQNFDWNNIITHGKSYAVLRLLAYEIGEDTFYKVFKYCLSSFGGKVVTPKMFQNVCEKESGKNLDWFFQQWYYTNDFLEYDIKTVTTDLKNNNYQINCTLNKIGEAQVSYLDIGFKTENGNIIIKTISGKEKQVNMVFETNNLFTSIIIDPNMKLPLINRKEWKQIN
jgi:hypothetical protein